MPMQKFSKTYPKRGEIFIADLNPSFGREIHKKRPVLIISSNILNQYSPTVVILPFSSIVPIATSPDMVKIEEGKLVDKDSVILSYHIRSIDKVRLIKRIGRLPKIKLEEVEESIKLILSLEENR